MSMTRSEQMRRVRGKNTSPELLLRKALWKAGLRYRLQLPTPVGRPDIVFPGPRVAIFVDGCFWHGCPKHYSRPRSRSSFWSEKLSSNVERDRRQTLELEASGWTVLRLWEHEVFSELAATVERVRRQVRDTGRADTISDWRVVRVTPCPELGPDFETRELSMLRDATTKRYFIGPRVGTKGRKPK